MSEQSSFNILVSYSVDEGSTWTDLTPTVAGDPKLVIEFVRPGAASSTFDSPRYGENFIRRKAGRQTLSDGTLTVPNTDDPKIAALIALVGSPLLLRWRAVDILKERSCNVTVGSYTENVAGEETQLVFTLVAEDAPTDPATYTP